MKIRIYIQNKYKICYYCGRKYTKEDVILIAHEQHVKRGWISRWKSNRRFCGEYCKKLAASTLTLPITSANRHQWGKYKKLIRYVLKYANTDILLKDVSLVF